MAISRARERSAQFWAMTRTRSGRTREMRSHIDSPPHESGASAPSPGCGLKSCHERLPVFLVTPSG